ncbi:hypothetical protein [Selenomonas ruminantium]|nr:hypothetical protein [Selenomonas ruminantium]
MVTRQQIDSSLTLRMTIAGVALVAMGYREGREKVDVRVCMLV